MVIVHKIGADIKMYNLDNLLLIRSLDNEVLLVPAVSTIPPIRIEYSTQEQASGIVDRVIRAYSRGATIFIMPEEEGEKDEQSNSEL